MAIRLKHLRQRSEPVWCPTTKAEKLNFSVGLCRFDPLVIFKFCSLHLNIGHYLFTYVDFKYKSLKVSNIGLDYCHLRDRSPCSGHTISILALFTQPKKKKKGSTANRSRSDPAKQTFPLQHVKSPACHNSRIKLLIQALLLCCNKVLKRQTLVSISQEAVPSSSEGLEVTLSFSSKSR